MSLQPFQSALDCCVVNKFTQLGQGGSQVCGGAAGSVCLGSACGKQALRELMCSQLMPKSLTKFYFFLESKKLAFALKMKRAAVPSPVPWEPALAEEGTRSPGQGRQQEQLGALGTGCSQPGALGSPAAQGRAGGLLGSPWGRQRQEEQLSIPGLRLRPGSGSKLLS